MYHQVYSDKKSMYFQSSGTKQQIVIKGGAESITKDHSISVLSWNVLSPDQYIPETSFAYYNETNDKRFKQMNNIIQNHDIYIFQEMPTDWAISMLETKEYYSGQSAGHLNTSGKKRMGVATIWNDRKFQHLHSQSIVVSKFIKRHSAIYSEIFSEETIKKVQRKKQTMLIVRLKDKRNGKQILVANYHFPCSFRYPEQMKLYARASQDFIKQYITKSGIGSISDPYVIFGTDANTRPDVDHFTKIYDNTLFKYTELPSKFSTWNKMMNDKFAFKAILDYIFVSKNFRVSTYKTILNKDGLSPNKSNPSDHYPIHCKLQYT